MVWELPFLFSFFPCPLFSPGVFPSWPDTSAGALTPPPSAGLCLLTPWELCCSPVPLGLWEGGTGVVAAPSPAAEGAGAQHEFLRQHNTMESLLERGEKLDDLVSKSEVLGAQSKAFYKTVSVGGPPPPCWSWAWVECHPWVSLTGDEPWGTALGARLGSLLLPQALGLERAWVPQFQLQSPPAPHWGCPAPCHAWGVMPIPALAKRKGASVSSTFVLCWPPLAGEGLCATSAGWPWELQALGELYRGFPFSSQARKQNSCCEIM